MANLQQIMKDHNRKIHLMAIVNVTSDSFYPGSRCLSENGEANLDLVAERVETALDEGAGIIDIGACSTRPGSKSVCAAEEWRRLEPALLLAKKIILERCGTADDNKLSIPGQQDDFVGGICEGAVTKDAGRPEANSPGIAGISIDTFRADIVKRAYELIGPFIVNDISAGEDDPEMLPLVGSLGLKYIAMHKRGTPADMQTLTDYGPEAAPTIGHDLKHHPGPTSKPATGSACRCQPSPVTAAVLRYFENFAQKAEEFSIKDWILDPGYGFAKTIEQNYQLLREQSLFETFGRPILVGISRKSMIYKLSGTTPADSLCGTQVLHLFALQHGADILRVHDVAEAARTVEIWRRLS